MSRFNDFDILVTEMMADFGFTALYQRNLPGIPNDATGGVDSPPPLSIPINCIRSELIKPLTGTGTNNGSSIQEGDLILYVQPTEKADEFATALVVDPSSDNVLIQGVTWSIVTVKLIASDPTDVILYELYIRK
jgi:hypothetical protein